MKLTNEFLDKKSQKGDPAADRVIAKLIDEKGIESSRILFDILIHNIELSVKELPEGAQEFILLTSKPPG